MQKGPNSIKTFVSMLLFINLKVLTANRLVEKRRSFGIMLLEFSSYRDLIVLELFVN